MEKVYDPTMTYDQCQVNPRSQKDYLWFTRFQCRHNAVVNAGQVWSLNFIESVDAFSNSHTMIPINVPIIYHVSLSTAPTDEHCSLNSHPEKNTENLLQIMTLIGSA